MEGGNYEAVVLVDRLTNVDRFFFETIRANARLVDDAMYSELKAWVQLNTTNAPRMPDLKEVISEAGSDAFLISALPMTHSVGTLAAGYARIRAGQDPSDDRDVTTCIFHDRANYSIPMGLSDSGFRRDLSARFFSHPFIRRVDGFIAPEACFGRIKEWIQRNCTDVPVPSRRELTGNVQVLLEWFVALGGGRYVVDVPGARSQRIRRL